MGIMFRGKKLADAAQETTWAEKEKIWAERAAATKLHEMSPTPHGFIRQRTPEWFESRKGKITASLAAGCLGLDRFISRAKAWRIIKGIEEDKPNIHKERGITREPTAVRTYEQRQGVKVDECGFVVHPGLPWLGASPDGLVGPMGLLEVKCPEKLPDAIPEAHLVQCRVQLACTGRWFCDYLAYAGPGRIFEYRVLRDVLAEVQLLLALQDFYDRYVLTDTCPPRKPRLKLPKGDS